jgi:hypothetical protein
MGQTAAGVTVVLDMAALGERVQDALLGFGDVQRSGS